MGHYANVLNRVDVVKKNVENLIRINKELETSNRKLRNDVDTLLATAAARERVLQAISLEKGLYEGKTHEI